MPPSDTRRSDGGGTSVAPSFCHAASGAEVADTEGAADAWPDGADPPPQPVRPPPASMTMHPATATTLTGAHIPPFADRQRPQAYWHTGHSPANESPGVLVPLTR